MSNAIDEFFERLFWSIMWWLLRLFMRLTWLLVQLMAPILEELMEIIGPLLVRLVIQPLVWSFVAIVVLWAMTDHGVVATIAAVTAASGVVIFVMVREHTL